MSRITRSAQQHAQTGRTLQTKASSSRLTVSRRSLLKAGGALVVTRTPRIGARRRTHELVEALE